MFFHCSVYQATVKESRALNLCRSMSLWEKSGREILSLNKVFEEHGVVSSRGGRKGNLEHLAALGLELDDL